MIKLNLSRIARKRGIVKLHKFLKDNGFHKDTATQLTDGTMDFVKFDKLEKLCELLVCEPYDILEWIPDAGVDVAKHPLRVMLPKPDDVEIKKILLQLPLDKLDELLYEAKKKAEGK